MFVGENENKHKLKSELKPAKRTLDLSSAELLTFPLDSGSVRLLAFLLDFTGSSGLLAFLSDLGSAPSSIV